MRFHAGRAANAAPTACNVAGNKNGPPQCYQYHGEPNHKRKVCFAMASSNLSSDLNWVETVGKPALASIREMVAALECDWDRLEELRDERDSHQGPEDGGDENAETWEEANPDDAEDLAELEAAAGDCESRDDAEQRITEHPLSLQFRSGWADHVSEFVAEEFELLLTTGGPAVRIMGELDGREFHRAWLEVQDWGKPWTHYYEAGAAEVLEAYCRCFCFDSE